MANYYEKMRTNYFNVKDADKFHRVIGNIVGEYGQPDIITCSDKDSQTTLYGFTLNGDVAGYRYGDSRDEDEDEVLDSAFDRFLDALQPCIADGDACIILEVGSENFRYLTGCATVITNKDMRILDLTSLAMQEAVKMLENPNWTTRCEY